MAESTKPRLTSFAPQFLVEDLDRSMAYYRKIGFSFGEPWDGFYAIGHLDGLELHLKEAPTNPAQRQWRRDNEQLDAAAGVDGIEAFYAQCVASGVAITKPLAATAWGTMDFYIEDPDGHILSFGGRPARARPAPSNNESRKPMNELTPVMYASGEEVLAGDLVTYFGNPGQVEFVADPRNPTPETTSYIDEFGGGAMVLDSKIGPVFLAPDRDIEMLVFVGRRK